MQIAALVFDDITPLDIVGPIEVMARLPGSEIVIVAKERGPVRDPRTHWTLTAEANLAEVTEPDILVIPGGPGVMPYAGNSRCWNGCAWCTARRPGARRYVPDRSCLRLRAC